jgi:hypothetical protein
MKNEILPPTAPSASARPIPNFSKYVIEPDGTVWRTDPTERGPKANLTRPLVPVIHPKGQSWAVFAYDDAGVRRRVRVAKLLHDTFGA